MLTSLVFLALQNPDGLARFADYWKRTNSFSVQVQATSNIAGVGKGQLTVTKPNSFRITMTWPTEDYAYVKSPQGSVEFERTSKLYQEYPPEPGLRPFDSAVGSFQTDSIPGPLLVGSLQPFVPKDATVSKTDEAGGGQTYTWKWGAPTQDSGHITAKISSDGKLLYFEQYFQTTRGLIHREYAMSNYEAPAKTTPSTFSLIPPLGFSMHHRSVDYLDFSTGDKPKFGMWSTASGKADLTEAAKGKLLIVRAPDSKPADNLLKFLSGRKLPVKTIVATLGPSGGDYWSPPGSMVDSLAVVGTPLAILVGKDGTVLGMWVGYDYDNPGQMLKEIDDTLKENDGQ